MNSEKSVPRSLPELTIRSVLLGALLSAVLAGANAYLGLFAGATVSASIPAAVISMALFRLFGRSSILENNAVQTAASAGESLAAGAIFTLPALILLGQWTHFSYFETTLICLTGGLLGALFTIPLRQALIVKQKLRFPEGVATAQVLKTGAEGGASVRPLVVGGIAGGLFKYLEGGAGIWASVLDLATFVRGKWFLYFGANLSPALLSVGYIVGFPIAVLVFIGGAISWYIAIPVYLYAHPELVAGADAVDVGYGVWSTQIRYLGVGAMVVGGLWTLWSIRSVLTQALAEGIAAFRPAKAGAPRKIILRTEKDLSMKFVIFAVLALLVPVFLIYLYATEHLAIALFLTLLLTLLGFLFSGVSGYMAGLVGSSNNPISGVTIATVLLTSLLLVVLLGDDSSRGPAAAILVAAVVCCAAAIAGDNMQDLKSGHIVGATPWRQQIMQMVGVTAGALVLAPILNLLHTAYGFGARTLETPNALPAPQATLMKSVADGVFGGGLPWTMISIGAAIGAAVILIDEFQKARGASFRVPVLSVALGLYLPLELDMSVLFGGIVSGLVGLVVKRMRLRENSPSVEAGHKRGLLFGSGLIAGESLAGILIAVPIAVTGSAASLHWVSKSFGPLPAVVALAAIAFWLYRLSLPGFDGGSGRGPSGDGPRNPRRRRRPRRGGGNRPNPTPRS